MTSTTCFALAFLCFWLATVIDRPWHFTTPRERLYGNFCCSVGFLFLTAALWVAL